MKRIILAIILCALSSCAAYADFAPNGNKTQSLTVNSTTINMTTDTAYSILATTGCKARLMPTSAKGTIKQFTPTVGVWNTADRNKLTPFLNLSGCTNGELRRQ